MRIRAVLDGRKHAFIVGSITCSQFTEPKPIRFLVDTGASLSTILSYDALRLGIDCFKLESLGCSFGTANGRRFAYRLKDAEITLITNDGLNGGTVTFSLQGMPCLPPPSTIDESMVAEEPYSLLGMDVLFLFKRWTYTDNTLILDDAPL